MAGKGKIIKPINPQSVYASLGIARGAAGYDVAYLCSNAHGAINKWSVIKPIRFDTPFGLSPLQFAGTSTDHANGIYYGLRCGLHNGSGDGTQDGSRGWAGLHRCDWAYMSVVPGVHYSRLSDFDGYDDNAVPNPTGNVAGVGTDDKREAVVHYDIPENLPCNVLCRTAGEDNVFADGLGVNLQEVAQTSDIGEWYPCILISDVNSDGEPVAPHYVRALAEAKDSVTEQNKYQPLRNSSGAWFGKYVAETHRSVGLNFDSGGLGINGPCKKMVTLFIKKEINNQLVDGDFTQWRDVSLEDIPVGKVFTVPDAVGIVVDYRRAYAQGLAFAGASAYASLEVIFVNVRVSWVKEEGNMPDREATYTFRANIEADGNPVGGESYTVEGKFAYPEEQGGATPAMQLVVKTSAIELLGASGTLSLKISWTVTSDKAGDHILNNGTEYVTYDKGQTAAEDEG